LGRRSGRSVPLPLTLFLLAAALGAGCAPGGCAANAPARDGASAGRSTTPAAAAPAPFPEVRSAKIVRIRDGDSLVALAGGVEIDVRLHGIDAPELGQAYGRRARRRAGELAFGKEVRLDARGTDSWGRRLAEVLLPDGRSLNRELVSEGLAWWYRKYAEDADLASREREARAARRGLWADPAPVPPWAWREAHPRR
jgi:endonuclease YncB( thermonuclease family)